jgi:hypothetical protein
MLRTVVFMFTPNWKLLEAGQREKHCHSNSPAGVTRSSEVITKYPNRPSAKP